MFSSHVLRFFSTSKQSNIVLMLNIGGPTCEAEITPFLTRFMSDYTIIRIPFKLGPLIGRLRGPYKVKKQYEAIGGYSPLLKWTEIQGSKLSSLLNQKFKESDEEFFCYPAFRYGKPLFYETINKALELHPHAKRMILFSQFPQYSCTTGGNSIREALAYLESMGMIGSEMEIKVIDRWFYNIKYQSTIARLVKQALEKNFDAGVERDNALILFTAHSLPYNFIAQGDPYSIEIAATADAVHGFLGRKNPYKLVWQSKVGFQTWLGPSTLTALEVLAKRGFQNVVLVPLGFTSDHLETLYEIDKEYVEIAKKLGFKKVVRCDSLNEEPDFIEALAEIVETNITEGKYESPNRRIKCFDCKFDICNKIACH